MPFRTTQPVIFPDQGRTDDPAQCDIPGSIPAYTPDAFDFDGTDVIYLLSKANRRIYRYSTASSRHLNPLVSRDAPTFMAYSPVHGRVYVAHEDGSISSIGVSSSLQTEFAAVPYTAHGLAAAGNFVVVPDGSGAWNSHSTFDVNGRQTEWEEWNYRSNEYAWSPSTSRLYFCRDDTSPNDILWELVDQSSGAITRAGESPYHGAYTIQRPIRVSRDGGYVLLGSGDIYDGIELRHQVALPLQPVDAVWLDGNALIALTPDATLHWFSNAFVAGKTLTLSRQPLRIFAGSTRLIAVDLGGRKPAFQALSY